MPQDNAVATIAHAIQLAVAPVFLLSAIGGMLAVLTNRLGRVVDRARRLEERVPANATDVARLNAELDTLTRRAKLVNQAVTLCTITALLISALIAVLFIGPSLHLSSAPLVAAMFVAAMVSLIAGLVAFLREIFLATGSLMIGRHAEGLTGERGNRGERTDPSQQAPSNKAG